jgi:hypothetical protein
MAGEGQDLTSNLAAQMAEQVVVSHPSSDCSRPSTLNLEFLLDELLEKKRYTLLI